MIININTATRVKNFSRAVETGIGSQLPKSPYTYSELGKGTIEFKMNKWSELKFATGKENPSRSDLRKYNKMYTDLGLTHDQRMTNILERKLVEFHNQNKEGVQDAKRS